MRKFGDRGWSRYNLLILRSEEKEQCLDCGNLAIATVANTIYLFLEQEQMSDRHSRKKWSRIDGPLISFLYFCEISIFCLMFLIAIINFLGDWSHREGNDVYVANISWKQQDYFRQYHTFARQLASLDFEFYSEVGGYSHRILFPSQPVQTQPSLVSGVQDLSAIATIAYPKLDRLFVHIGVIQKTVNPTQIKLDTQLKFCQSKSDFGILKSQGDIDFGFPELTDSDRTNTKFSCPTNFRETEWKLRGKSQP